MALDQFWTDLRLACRNAARRPGFASLLVLTLALGVGVDSAVFALVDGVLLRPLPYRDPARIVFVWQTFASQNIAELEPTAFDYDSWHALRSFSTIAMIRTDSFTIAGESDPERVRGARMTASTLPLLGLTPIAGRAFRAEEDLAGTAPVAILSNGLWRRRFGGDDTVVGKTIQVDGEARTIVGVMPRGASLPGPLAGDDDLWLPMRLTADERANEVYHSNRILGRVADDVTVEQASAELTSFARQMAAERPSHRQLGARLVPLREQTVRTIRPTLWLLTGGVVLLLLVASANASTLLLARAANRSREHAVRVALGATPGRLLSVALAESLLFSTCGGIVGLTLGAWTLRLLLPLFAGTLPVTSSVAIDGRVTLFTTSITLALAMLFAAVTTLQARGTGLADALKASGRAVVPSGGRSHRALVVAQVAFAVMLLAAAGLMLNSVVKLSRVNPGFDVDRLLTFNVALTDARYAAPGVRTAFVSDFLGRLTAAPFIERAAVTSILPFSGRRGANSIEIEGHPAQPGVSLIADQRHVSTDYFRTMNIPLAAGRAFAATDDARGEQVAVINRTMARRFWNGGNPIGRRVRTAAGFDSGVWFRIVGVVDDVRHVSLSRDPVAEMYRPILQTATPMFTVVVRTTRDPAVSVPTVRSTVQAIDANLPIYDVRPMTDRVAATFAQTRGAMALLSVSAILASLLAGVAIYGSIWYSVSHRIPEIGVRLALGASRRSVFGDVLRRAVALSAVGAVFGIVGAIAGGRLMAGLLFDTRPTDPLTLLGVAAMAILVAVAAALRPAHRAMRVDPAIALRGD